MTTHKDRAIAMLEKALDRVNKVHLQTYGFTDVRDRVEAARDAIDDALILAKALPDDAKPARKPRGAHVVAGRIYEIKEKARRHYEALGADLSACVVESITGDSARVLFTDAEGSDIRAAVKLAHLGKEQK